MKNFSLLFLLLIGGAVYAQGIEGIWRTDELLTYRVKEQYVMTFVNRNDETVEVALYGNFIVFKDDGTFTSNYAAPCGNDCFTSSEGVFTYKGQDQIVLTLHQVEQSGTCSSSRVETVELGVYDIQREKDYLLLSKHKK